MGIIEPQALYTEFELDPSDLGYRIGNGVSFQDKQAEINLVRGTITVTRVAEDTPIDPGEVAEAVAIQAIRDAIDGDEYEANCRPNGGATELTIAQASYLRDRIATFYGGSDGQSLFAFTTLSKQQILGLFTNPDWSQTRTNLIDLQTRDGTRAEQLFGSPDAPVTRQDMLDAEAWGQANGKPTLYE